MGNFLIAVSLLFLAAGQCETPKTTPLGKWTVTTDYLSETDGRIFDEDYEINSKVCGTVYLFTTESGVERYRAYSDFIPTGVFTDQSAAERSVEKACDDKVKDKKWTFES